MRLLLLSSYVLPHRGGIEVLVDLEARLFAQAGHEVTVIACDAGVGKMHLDKSGIRYRLLPAWNGFERYFEVPWPVFAPSLLSLLWREVRRCDLVHAHGMLPLTSVLALWFARLQNKPSLLTEHSGDMNYASPLKNLVFKTAMQTLGRASTCLARAATVFNEEVRRCLHSLAPRKRVDVLANPLDTALFHTPSEDERHRAQLALGGGRKRVLYIGRLVEKKGLDVLMAAFDGSYELLVCGDGTDAMRQMLKERGIRYVAPCPQPELVKLYHAADMLVLPSRSEGNLPLVAQEALLCGLPVLLGKFPGSEQYARFANLHFCDTEVAALRDGIRRVLAGESGQTGQVRLESALQTPQAWVSAIVALGSGEY